MIFHYDILSYFSVFPSLFFLNLNLKNKFLKIFVFFQNLLVGAVIALKFMVYYTTATTATTTVVAPQTTPISFLALTKNRKKKYIYKREKSKSI